MGSILNDGRALIKERRFRDLNKLFENIFAEYFKGKGYRLHKPAPLLSTEDKSVGFTGSSTNVLKPYILSGEYPIGSGYVVSQECLRNHALDFAYDNSWLPFGQAYFHMSTILSKPGRFKEAVGEMTDFTLEKVGISKEDIIAKSSKLFEDLLEIDKHTSIGVEYDTLKEQKYKWVYGMQDIRGEGITISVQDKIKGVFLDVGNLVKFLDSSNKERGLEFGYGHEFLLSKVFGVENPLSLSEVFEIFEFRPDISSKYFGYVEAVSRIKKEKDTAASVRSTVRGVYNKYLRALDHLRVPVGKSRADLFRDLEKFAESIASCTNFENEKEYLESKRYIL